MSVEIIDSGGTARDLLEVGDLAPNKFACIGGLMEPIVSTDSSLSGTGSSNSPLSVNFPGFAQFTVTDDPVSGSFTITDSETLTFEAITNITTNIDVGNKTVEIDFAPVQTPACSLGYFTG